MKSAKDNKELFLEFTISEKDDFLILKNNRKIDGQIFHVDNVGFFEIDHLNEKSFLTVFFNSNTIDKEIVNLTLRDIIFNLFRNQLKQIKENRDSLLFFNYIDGKYSKIIFNISGYQKVVYIERANLVAYTVCFNNKDNLDYIIKLGYWLTREMEYFFNKFINQNVHKKYDIIKYFNTQIGSKIESLRESYLNLYNTLTDEELGKEILYYKEQSTSSFGTRIFYITERYVVTINGNPIEQVQLADNNALPF